MPSALDTLKRQSALTYPGNIKVQVTYCNPPVEKPRIVDGVIQFDDDGQPIYDEQDCVLVVQVRFLDEDGEFYGKPVVLKDADIPQGILTKVAGLGDDLYGILEGRYDIARRRPPKRVRMGPRISPIPAEEARERNRKKNQKGRKAN